MAIIVFDDVLKKVGEFSRFQKLQWFLLFLTTLPQAWYTYAPAFTAAKVKDNQVICTSSNTTGGCHANCTSVRYDVDYTSIATEWDIVCGYTFKIPLTKSAFYAGKFFGAYLFGWLSDRYGRRMVFFVTAIVQFVCSLASSFSTGYYMYLLLRIPIGVCSGGNFMVAFLLATEMCGIKYRGLANGLIHSGYGIGIAIEALFAHLVREWQYFNLLITLPNLFFILYWWWIPESPRWLNARGRTQEAQDILHKIAKTNNVQSCHEVLLKLEDNNVKETQEDTTPTTPVKTYYIWDLFRTKRLRMITCIEGFSWLVTSMVYYGLSFNSDDLAGNTYVNFAIGGLVEIPAYSLASVLVDRIGRRVPLIMYFVTGGTSLLCILPIVLTGKDEDLKELVITLSMIGKFAISACYYQVYIHTAELYPTVIRNNGLGFASLCSRIGGICAPFIVDGTPTIFPFVVFGAASFIAGILSFFLPETLNKPLPELDSDLNEIADVTAAKVEVTAM